MSIWIYFECEDDDDDNLCKMIREMCVCQRVSNRVFTGNEVQIMGPFKVLFRYLFYVNSVK